MRRLCAYKLYWYMHLHASGLLRNHKIKNKTINSNKLQKAMVSFKIGLAVYCAYRYTAVLYVH